MSNTLTESSFKLLSKSRQHLGTCWSCCPGQFVTAAHCIGNRQANEIQSDECIAVAHEGTEIPLELMREKVCFSLDAAILKTSSKYSPKACSIWSKTGESIESLSDQKLSWYCWAFPTAHSEGMVLTGTVSNRSS